MEKRPIMLTLDEARDLYKNESWKKVVLSTYTKEELEGPTLPAKWKDLGLIEGYFIMADSVLCAANRCNSNDGKHKNVFATKELAQSALAMAQLSQLMKAYNGDWVPDWKSRTQHKWVIKMSDGDIDRDDFYQTYHFLAFPTNKLRDQFLINFEGLIRQYFMI